MTHEVETEENENSERWLLSYSDFITLLMAFFIILYAMGQMDLKKYEALKTSLGSAFSAQAAGGIGKGNGKNIISSGDGPVGGARSPGKVKNSIPPEFLSLTNEIDREINKDGHKLTYEADKKGIIIHLPDTLMFPPGSAELTPEAKDVLAKLSGVLASEQNPVRVEGHTDNIPVAGGEYPSNWELSTSRATKVVNFWLGNTSISPARFSAAGYGEYHPVASNSTEPGRAKNRRVDIVIIRQELADKYGL